MCFGENLLLEFHFAPIGPASAAQGAAGLDELADDCLGEEHGAGDYAVVDIAEADRGRVYVNAEYSHDLARVGAGDRLNGALKLDTRIWRELLHLCRDHRVAAARPAANAQVITIGEACKIRDVIELSEAVHG